MWKINLKIGVFDDVRTSCIVTSNVQSDKIRSFGPLKYFATHLGSNVLERIKGSDFNQIGRLF